MNGVERAQEEFEAELQRLRTNEEFERARAAAAEAQFRRLFKSHARLLAAAKEVISVWGSAKLENLQAAIAAEEAGS
jgi:hypothetical protein